MQPVGHAQHVCQWCYVYGAVEPTTGDRFFLELLCLHANNFQICIDLFAQAFPDRLHLLLLDNRGAHTAQQRTLPEDARAWLQFPNLEEPQDDGAMHLQAYEAATLHALTTSPYLIEAIHA